MVRKTISNNAAATSFAADTQEAHHEGWVRVPKSQSWIRKLLSFMGPGYLVAVGYMDPGNWATDLEGGSKFGYSLLWVILLSNLMALVLQSFSSRLGLVTGLDLAQACKRYYSRPTSFVLWILAEIGICATDLAEVIGTAIALKLIFSIPLEIGVLLTFLDVFLVLALQKKHVRHLETFIAFLIATVLVCFAIILDLSEPKVAEVASGLIPQAAIFQNPEMLYIAIGILGATVMPHNLYLHSSIVKSRWAFQQKNLRSALQLANWDTGICLTIAFLANSAILITCASVFFGHGELPVTTLENAHSLLNPLLGTTMASGLFGLALLAAGQSSAITTTLAGQVVMEGMTNLRLSAPLRRLVTRSLAMIPAVAVTWMYGESETARLLVLSQVILSLQLPFAMIPLLKFTGCPDIMGPWANSKRTQILAWALAFAILAANSVLIWNLL